MGPVEATAGGPARVGATAHGEWLGGPLAGGRNAGRAAPSLGRGAHPAACPAPGPAAHRRRLPAGGGLRAQRAPGGAPAGQVRGGWRRCLRGRGCSSAAGADGLPCPGHPATHPFTPCAARHMQTVPRGHARGGQGLCDQHARVHGRLGCAARQCTAPALLLGRGGSAGWGCHHVPQLTAASGAPPAALPLGVARAAAAAGRAPAARWEGSPSPLPSLLLHLAAAARPTPACWPTCPSPTHLCLHRPAGARYRHRRRDHHQGGAGHHHGGADLRAAAGAQRLCALPGGGQHPVCGGEQGGWGGRAGGRQARRTTVA